jgi:hypothetical protein
MGSFARSGSGGTLLPPQNAPNALGRAAFHQSRCRERPRSSRPARPPSMSASRAACRPQNRRPEDLRTPRPLASRRPELLGARRPASFTEPPTGRSTRTLLDVSPGVASVPTPSPFGVARNGSGRVAPVRGLAPNGSGRVAQVRRVAPNGLGRGAPVRGAARNGSGRAVQARPLSPNAPVRLVPTSSGHFLRPRAPLPVS